MWPVTDMQLTCVTKIPLDSRLGPDSRVLIGEIVSKRKNNSEDRGTAKCVSTPKHTANGNTIPKTHAMAIASANATCSRPAVAVFERVRLSPRPSLCLGPGCTVSASEGTRVGGYCSAGWLAGWRQDGETGTHRHPPRSTAGVANGGGPEQSLCARL